MTFWFQLQKGNNNLFLVFDCNNATYIQNLSSVSNSAEVLIGWILGKMLQDLQKTE
jgi:hypothetical protein